MTVTDFTDTLFGSRETIIILVLIVGGVLAIGINRRGKAK